MPHQPSHLWNVLIICYTRCNVVLANAILSLCAPIRTPSGCTFWVLGMDSLFSISASLALSLSLSLK